MSKPKPRHYFACRRCGCSHKNPASSSICTDCGPIEALENLKRKEQIAEMEKRDMEYTDE